MNVAGRRILILGLAREGIALARYFSGLGAQVTATDTVERDQLRGPIDELEAAGVRLILGGDRPDLVAEADDLYVSPGVPEDNAVYSAARCAGLHPQSMTTLFFDLCPAKIVGVTGSSGKTTTTGLIGHILYEAGIDVHIGGNIGDPMLDLLPQLTANSVAVLELSSFQLSLLGRSPGIAVVTNISPNHLDRHGTMESYIAAKLHIVAHQGREDHAVLNAADSAMQAFATATSGCVHWFGSSKRHVPAATVRNGSIGLADSTGFRTVIAADQVPLPGHHNLENILAALAAVDLLGIDAADMARAIRTFKLAPHRLQTVEERGGIRYVDDSIATSPARSVVALRALEQPVVLIAGGRDKKLPWDEFAHLTVEKTRGLVLIGEAADQIEEAVREQMKQGIGVLRPENIRRCQSLEDAVCEAHRLARPGDVVLLSPGCTSYDMYRNFEERGEAFMHAVRSLYAA